MERRMRIKMEEEAMAAQWNTSTQPGFVPNADGNYIL